MSKLYQPMKIEQSMALGVYIGIYILTIFALLFFMKRKYKRNWLKTDWKFGNGRIDIRILVGFVTLVLMFIFKWTYSLIR